MPSTAGICVLNIWLFQDFDQQPKRLQYWKQLIDEQLVSGGNEKEKKSLPLTNERQCLRQFQQI